VSEPRDATIGAARAKGQRSIKALFRWTWSEAFERGSEEVALALSGSVPFQDMVGRFSDAFYQSLTPIFSPDWSKPSSENDPRGSQALDLRQSILLFVLPRVDSCRWPWPWPCQQLMRQGPLRHLASSSQRAEEGANSMTSPRPGQLRGRGSVEAEDTWYEQERTRRKAPWQRTAPPTHSHSIVSLFY
jgi:hypothetical protein